MISEAKIIIAKQLILQGQLSQRRIARETGLSRGTIHALVAGKRNIKKRKPQFLIEHKKKSPYVRCPECGSRVRIPCVFCTIRKQQEQVRHFVTEGVDIDCSINLSGEERKRYLEVRKWRQQCNNPHFTEIPDDWPWRET